MARSVVAALFVSYRLEPQQVAPHAEADGGLHGGEDDPWQEQSAFPLKRKAQAESLQA